MLDYSKPIPTGDYEDTAAPITIRPVLRPRRPAPAPAVITPTGKLPCPQCAGTGRADARPYARPCAWCEGDGAAHEPGAAYRASGYAAADTPEKLGAYAAHAGGDIEEDNPFDSGTAQHTDWRRGFAHEQERRDEQACAFTPRLITTTDTFDDLRPQNGTDFRLAELYAALGCSLVEVVYLGSSGLILIIDEEGALSSERELNSLATALWWRYEPAAKGQPLFGAALLCHTTQFR